MLKIKNLKNNPVVFNWLLILTAVSLVFPDYSLVSKFMILLAIYWLFFYNSLQEKIWLLKQNWLPFLSVSFLFWIAVIGMIYSHNLRGAIHDLILKLPFLLLPLIIFSSKNIIGFKTVYKYFSFTVLFVSISSIFQALILKYLYETDYMYYQEFSFFTNKHPTYFGLMLVLAFIYFLIDVLKNKQLNFINLLALFFLLITLFINANRMSLIIVFLDALFLSWYGFSGQKKWLSVFLLLLLSLGMTQTHFFQNRILPSFNQKDGDLVKRIRNANLVIKTIQNQNFLIGRGTESNRDDLYQRYKQAGAKIAYKEKYNAHNQFLETTLDFGFLGLLVLLIFMGYHLYRIIKHKQIAFLVIYLSIVAFMFTESILERQVGIILFALFLSLILREMNPSKHKKENFAT